MSDREEEVKKIPMRKPEPETWPPGVRGLGIVEVDAFGVDVEGTLYWHGKPVEIRRPLELSRTQAAFGIAAAIAGISLAVLDALRFFGMGH